MKSKSLHESLQDHIRLTQQEIFRWRISFVGTLVLCVLQMVFIAAQVLFQPYRDNQSLIIDGAIIAGLLLLLYWYHRRQQASERLLHTLSE